MVNRQDKFQGQALSSMSCLYGHTLQKQNKTEKKNLEQKARDVYKISFNTDCVYDSREQPERGF